MAVKTKVTVIAKPPAAGTKGPCDPNGVAVGTDADSRAGMCICTLPLGGFHCVLNAFGNVEASYAGGDTSSPFILLYAKPGATFITVEDILAAAAD